jgi:hypothetical protein
MPAVDDAASVLIPTLQKPHPQWSSPNNIIILTWPEEIGNKTVLTRAVFVALSTTIDSDPRERTKPARHVQILDRM